MRRKYLIYPTHPCIACGQPTTNKNYCDTHLTRYMRAPAIKRSAGTSITADECTRLGQRREDVTNIR